MKNHFVDPFMDQRLFFSFSFLPHLFGPERARHGSEGRLPGGLHGTYGHLAMVVVEDGDLSSDEQGNR